MKNFIPTLAAAALVLSTAAPVLAEQIAASPGVTLTEAAQMKFNADTGSDTMQRTVVPGMSSDAARTQLIASGGLTVAEAEGLSLNDLLIAKVNRNGDRDSRQWPVESSVTVATRSVSMPDPQLLSAAGLTEAEAAGLTLNEIAIAKFNRDSSRDNRIRN